LISGGISKNDVSQLSLLHGSMSTSDATGFIVVGDSSAHPDTSRLEKKTEFNIDIYYKDWGSGQPIVFSHGWPLSADD
jgi:hypothetical protein